MEKEVGMTGEARSETMSGRFRVVEEGGITLLLSLRSSRLFAPHQFLPVSNAVFMDQYTTFKLVVDE